MSKNRIVNLLINYADENTIGYRTTNSTKVQISTLSGYPTGKTIVGAIAYPSLSTEDSYGAIFWVDGGGYLKGASKTARTAMKVDILVLYF